VTFTILSVSRRLLNLLDSMLGPLQVVQGSMLYAAV